MHSFTGFDLQRFRDHFADTLPRRGRATFLFTVGDSLILVWARLDILPAPIQGSAPTLTPHPMLPTQALDIGVIEPWAILAGVLLLRSAPLRYLLASVLLVVSTALDGGVMAPCAGQLLAHVLSFSQTIVFMTPFVVLALFALWFTLSLFRSLSERCIA